MTNLKVLNADRDEKYLKQTGAGTDLDPHIPYNQQEDGANVALGTTTDPAILAAVDGTLVARVRNLSALLEDVHNTDDQSLRTTEVGLAPTSLLLIMAGLSPDPAGNDIQAEKNGDTPAAPVASDYQIAANDAIRFLIPMQVAGYKNCSIRFNPTAGITGDSVEISIESYFVDGSSPALAAAKNKTLAVECLAADFAAAEQVHLMTNPLGVGVLAGGINPVDGSTYQIDGSPAYIVLGFLGGAALSATVNFGLYVYRE